MEVLNDKPTIYVPQFDADSGRYFDESPFKLHSRNNVMYTCLCNHSHFNTMTSFNTHIKTKSHLKFLVNYKLYIKDTEDAQSSSNDYQSKYELADRRCKHLTKNISDLEKEIAQHKLLNLILRYQLLKMDKFEDCSDTIDDSDVDSDQQEESV